MRTRMNSCVRSKLHKTCCPLALHRTCTRNRNLVRVEASIRARWCLDVRYGCKAEATALLQEWVSTIGSRAGLNAANTRLSYGHLGVPESRLEMEATFDSMSDWEAFLASLPAKEHTAWGQRIRSVIVDGSTIWQVYQSVPLHSTTAQAATTAAATGSTSVRNTSKSPIDSAAKQLLITDQISTEDMLVWQQLTGSGKQQQQQESVTGSSQPETAPAADVPLDWKGEPMKINPGDKLPFKFL